MAKKSKASVAATAMPSDFDGDEWRGRNDFETLQSADEIKQDPSRMKGARAHGKKRLASTQRVMGSMGRR